MLHGDGGLREGAPERCCVARRGVELEARRPVDAVDREAQPRIVVREHLIPAAVQRCEVVLSVPVFDGSAVEQLAAGTEVLQRAYACALVRDDLGPRGAVLENHL